jgi:gluconate 2-dehydrogenase gamma chain
MKTTGFTSTCNGLSAAGLADRQQALAEWEQQLTERRHFLLGLVGGSLAALFPGIGSAASAATNADTNDDTGDEAGRWAIISAVQEQLFPTEAGAPGASEIHALSYLQRAMLAPDRDPGERVFILQGAGWLQQLATDHGGGQGGGSGGGFVGLDSDGRERLLRRIAASEAGENWLSTLIVHILEALLTEPVYGGNPGGIGWAWLKHAPGFPHPDVPYWQLPCFRA